MRFFNIGAGAHDAVVSQDRTKTSREGLINRTGFIKRALGGELPKEKRAKIKAELRGILLELDAREEAVNTIMAKFED